MMEMIRKTLPYLGGIVLIVGLALFSVVYERGIKFSNPWILASLIVLGSGVAMLLLAFLLRSFGPNFKYHVSYVLTSVFVLGTMAMIYLIVENHSIEYDATAKKLHTLHPRTMEYLKSIDQPVTITAFPGSDMEERQIKSVLKQFSRQAPKIQVRVKNAYRDKREAEALGGARDGDVFVEIGERPEKDVEPSEGYRKTKLRMYEMTESKLVNAIVEVVRPDQITLYFLEGHNEVVTAPPDAGFGSDAEPELSYSKIARYLRTEQSYQVKTIKVLQTGYVADDCSVLVCPGPRLDLFPLEKQAIQRYLDAGGRAFFLLDPNELETVRFDQWTELLAGYGVEIVDDVVIEGSPFSRVTEDPRDLVAMDFASHPIVRGLSGGRVLMLGARTVRKVEDTSSAASVTELMYSSPLSWPERIETLRHATELQPPPRDRIKKQPLGVAVTKESSGEGPMRMVVLGDSSLFRDDVIDDASLQLFLNATNWLVAREDLLDIPIKRLEDTPIYLSPARRKTILLTFIFGFPGAVLFAGLAYVMVRRRAR